MLPAWTSGGTAPTPLLRRRNEQRPHTFLAVILANPTIPVWSSSEHRTEQDLDALIAEPRRAGCRIFSSRQQRRDPQELIIIEDVPPGGRRSRRWRLAGGRQFGTRDGLRAGIELCRRCVREG